MLSMPFLIFGIFCGSMYLAVRRGTGRRGQSSSGGNRSIEWRG